nr:hypothetical protein Itr_chr02CG14490 [Ipomoea trifida]
MADPITLSVSSSRQQLAPTKAAAATKPPVGASSSFPFHFSIKGGCEQLVTAGQSIAEEIQPRRWSSSPMKAEQSLATNSGKLARTGNNGLLFRWCEAATVIPGLFEILISESLPFPYHHPSLFRSNHLKTHSLSLL